MSSANVPVTCVLMLAGVGIYFAPDNVALSVRSAVSDSLKPGQTAVRQLVNLIRDKCSMISSDADQSKQQKIERLQQELDEAQTRSVALQIQLARLTDLQARQQSLPESLRKLPPLTSSSLIEATVLGNALAERWRKGKMLDRGELNGVRESELVIKSSHPLVDLGRDGSLSPEDGLLLGRCVIGKIERVGRWTSTFLLLTDTGYRGRAQLFHETDTGFVFGAKGILEGQGSGLCQLKGIAASEAVAVGDAVYTATREGQQSTPLYYGRVVEAALGPSDSEWRVMVQPVAIPNDLSTVQILRSVINPDRSSAGS